jgi:hypothetical protein
VIAQGNGLGYHRLPLWGTKDSNAKYVIRPEPENERR